MFRIIAMSLFVTLCVTGCGSSDDQTSQANEKGTSNAAAAEKDSKATKKTSIFKKTTQDIAKFDPAAGRKIRGSKIDASNPFTASLDAYGPGMQKAATIGVTKRVTDYYNFNGRYPTYDEFMKDIVKAEPQLRLPVLPYKMEYQYDEANHKLVVVHPLEEPTDDKKPE